MRKVRFIYLNVFNTLQEQLSETNKWVLVLRIFNHFTDDKSEVLMVFYIIENLQLAITSPFSSTASKTLI